MRIGVASLIAFVVVFVLSFVIQVDNPQTSDFPAPQTVAIPAETVRRVSGATYGFDNSRAGWGAMTLTFEGDRAAVQLVFEDESADIAIGFDGQYLPNSDGTAEATGFWRSDQDFVVYFRQGDHRPGDHRPGDYRPGDYREIWDIKFGAEDEVLFRIRDGVGVRLQLRFTGTRQS